MAPAGTQRRGAVGPLSHTPGPGPDDELDRREQLRALSDAIGQLSDRQHEVFVAVALNDVSVDELAVQLDSNSNAIYKNLFDARRALRARMAIAGCRRSRQHDNCAGAGECVRPSRRRGPPLRSPRPQSQGQMVRVGTTTASVTIDGTEDVTDELMGPSLS